MNENLLFFESGILQSYKDCMIELSTGILTSKISISHGVLKSSVIILEQNLNQVKN